METHKSQQSLAGSLEKRVVALQMVLVVVGCSGFAIVFAFVGKGLGGIWASYGWGLLW